MEEEVVVEEDNDEQEEKEEDKEEEEEEREDEQVEIEEDDANEVRLDTGQQQSAQGFSKRGLEEEHASTPEHVDEAEVGSMVWSADGDEEVGEWAKQFCWVLVVVVVERGIAQVEVGFLLYICICFSCL